MSNIRIADPFTLNGKVYNTPVGIINGLIDATKLPDDGSVHFAVISPSSIDPTDPMDLTKMKFTCMGDITFKKSSLPGNPYYFSIKKEQIDALYTRYITYKALSTDLAYVLSSIIFVPVYGSVPLEEGTEYDAADLQALNSYIVKDYPLGFQINARLGQRIKTKIDGQDAWPMIDSDATMGPITILGDDVQGWAAMFQGVGYFIEKFYMADANATTFYMNIGFTTELGAGGPSIQITCTPTRITPEQE